MCSISSKALPSKCPCDCCSLEEPLKDLKYRFPEELRKKWEEWDMRILVLYILFTQLSLYLLGRRRKSTARILMCMNVWLLYLFSDLLATIGLGKLSKVNSANNRKPPKGTDGGNGNHPKGNNSENDPMSLLRGLWAPIILFYLGGPDSITVLKLEENEMWSRHLVGLLTQGLRTGYVLFITWAESWLSFLALLMLVPAILKYGERVWVMKSIARGKYEGGFVRLDESTIARLDKVNNNIARPNAKLVLQAYSYFQTLKPHVLSYARDRSRLDSLIKDSHERVTTGTVQNTFRLIEIESGFMYDVLFSKAGAIFTLWGCILRFISFSCIVGVFVGFFLVKKPYGEHLKIDLPITIILLVGAIFLEVAAALEQLLSDWAVVWAYKHQSKLVTPVFRVQEFVISKRKRLPEPLGQFNLVNFCNNYKPTKLDGMMESLWGRETILKVKFNSPASEVRPGLKALIINQVHELTSQSFLEVEALQSSFLKRGEWTFEKYGCLQEFKWSVELEFDESIVIWHVATEICHHSEDPNSLTDEVEPTKILSNYIMHLLLRCRSRFPICKTNDKFSQARADQVKEIFEREPILSNAEACKLLLQKQSGANTVNHIQKLARDLMENENKWRIMSSVWVEILCYAASHCPVKNHVQGLRQGGELLTHVWLLLMHFGVTQELGQNRTPILPETGRLRSQ